MSDRDLERRLQAWYRDGAGDDETAPAELRARVAAIPAPAPTSLRPLRDRRGLTLLAAAAFLLVGGAFAAGSGLFRVAPVDPSTPPDALLASDQPPGPSDTTDPSEAPVPTPASAVRNGDLVAFIRVVQKEADCPRLLARCNYSRLWIANADGSDAHELLPDGLGQQSPMAWTPDGSGLLYSDIGGLYLIDPAGGEPQAVETGCARVLSGIPLSCHSDSQVAFSGDGRRLVFVRESTDADGYRGPSVLTTMDLASGRVTELTSTSASAALRPGWSPDGRRIVFWRYGYSDDGSFLPRIADAVYVVDADGSNLRQASPPDMDAREAQWSPDGTRIVFLSPGPRLNEASGTPYGDIYTMRPDGSDVRRLTDHGLATNPTWAPDGRILYTRSATGGDLGEAGWWIVDADGTDAAVLATAETLGLSAVDLGPDRPILQPVGGAPIVAPPWTPAPPIAVGPAAPTPAPTPAPELAAGFTWTGTSSIADETPLGQTATLLLDGRVLVTQGCGVAAELYDPATGTFSPTGSLTATRGGATATRLDDGRVLVAGGYACGAAGDEGLWATAEVYDPATGMFSPTGSMRSPREFHTATLLEDGSVLVAGGLTGPAAKVAGGVTLASVRTVETTTALASAEIYDPATGTFSKAGSMGTARLSHTATRLADGRVLVTGAGAEGLASTTSAEVYDPATDRWSPTGSMAKGRSLHTATLLGDGRVVVVGGRSSDDSVERSVELYDPRGGTFQRAGAMDDGRQGHTATLLPDGRVLVTGGWWSNGRRYRVLSSAELFDPGSETFSPIGSMGTPRNGHTATLLPDGRVLIAGGSDLGYEGGEGVTSAVLYQP